jgi:NAD+ kinase
MSIPENTIDSGPPTHGMPSCIGLVVHPTRSLEEPLAELREWAAHNAVELVQISGFDHQQQVADKGDPGGCDLIVSVGGDGTTLAAIRAGVDADRPVLGVACGSLGVLTAVTVGHIKSALDRFGSGDWVANSLPALDVKREAGAPLLALNDLVIVRAGEGQTRIRVSVDGALFARISGDGCIVSTPLGSSAYTLSAGGPLLAPATNAFVLTPLSPHGGSCPPFVIGAGSELVLDTAAGYGGARLELDGQVADLHMGRMTIAMRPDVATVVSFDGQEQFIAGLRQRKIIADSPRILAEDARSESQCD